MKILLTSLVIGICSVGFVKAQNMTTFTYSVGFPTGDVQDFIQKTSFRGINFEFQKLVQPSIGVGLSFGWNVFYEVKDYDTYTIDNASLSGKQYRYSNHIPIMLTGNYYLKSGETVNPFVGLGFGTMYSGRNTDMNLFTLEEDAWNLALKPTVGLLFNTNDVVTFHVSASYYYGFQAGNELETAQSFIGLNFGFTFD